MTDADTDPTPKLAGYRVALWAVVAASTVPLWLVRCLPCVDLPQHLEFVSILRNIADPALGYAGIYAIRLYPAHNVLHLLFTYLWSFPLGIELANKLFFSAYVVGFALALDYLLKALKANRWYGLLGMLFVYNFNFYWGFPGVLAALPLLLFGLALALEWLSGNGQSPLRWILLVLTWVLMFLAHALGFAILLLLFGVVLLLAPRGDQARPRTDLLLASLAPAIVLFVVPWLFSLEFAHANGGLRQLSASFEGELVIDRLLRIGGFVLTRDPASVALSVALPILVAVRVMLTIARRGLRALRSRAPLVAAGLTLTCLVCYLVLPRRFDLVTVLSDRFAVLSYIFLAVLLAAVPGTESRSVRFVAPVVLAVLLLNLVSVTWQFRELDRTARAGLKLLCELPPGRSVVGLVYGRRLRGIRGYPVLTHFANYYPVLRGGRAGFSFARIPYSPIRLREGGMFLEPGQEVFPWKSLFPDKWRDYDYLLVRGTPRPQDSVCIAQCELVGSDPGWMFYAVPPDSQAGSR